MTPDENPLVDRAERVGTLISRLEVQLGALDVAHRAMTGTGIYRDGWVPTPFGLDETRGWCWRVSETAVELVEAMRQLESATATMVVHGRDL